MLDLQVKEQEVLGYLSNNSSMLGQVELCRVSRYTLAKAVNRSPTSVWRTLRRLRRKRMLRAIYNYKTFVDIYQI